MSLKKRAIMVSGVATLAMALTLAGVATAAKPSDQPKPGWGLVNNHAVSAASNNAAPTGPTGQSVVPPPSVFENQILQLISTFLQNFFNNFFH